jgi:hypothetical protein
MSGSCCRQQDRSVTVQDRIANIPPFERTPAAEIGSPIGIRPARCALQSNGGGMTVKLKRRNAFMVVLGPASGMDGRVVYGAQDCSALSPALSALPALPALPEILPAWSPIKQFGGHHTAR